MDSLATGKSTYFPLRLSATLKAMKKPVSLLRSVALVCLVLFGFMGAVGLTQPPREAVKIEPTSIGACAPMVGPTGIQMVELRFVPNNYWGF